MRSHVGIVRCISSSLCYIDYSNIEKEMKRFCKCGKVDNRRCVELTHLKIGTHSENRLDCIMKGRHAKGEVVGGSKLTEQQVKAIRSCYKFRVTRQKDIAIQYGVSQDIIHKILSRKVWRHVS